MKPESGTAPKRPRIEPVSEPTEEQQTILAKTRVGDQPPANVFRTLAHNPRLLKRFNLLGGYFMAHSSLPPRLRELSILRTAHLSACQYEFEHHRKLALSERLLNEDEIAALRDEGRITWSPEERYVLDATEELWVFPYLQQASWSRLARFLDTEQLMDLILLVGFYRGLAGFINTIAVELEDQV